MSFVTVMLVALPTLPARSVELALIVSVPSPSPATFTPLMVIEPAPFVPACVVVTLLPPFETVSLTVSLASALAASEIDTEMLEALPALTYALPAPPPLASKTLVGAPGGVASAVAVTVELSTLVRSGEPLETAVSLYVYVVPSAVAVSL